MTKINQDYSIKNIKAENLVLTYNVSNNKFFLLDNNKTILNDNYIKKFQLEPVSKNNYYLSFKHNNKIKKKKLFLYFLLINLIIHYFLIFI